MTRTMLRPCTASVPASRPSSLFFQGAGYASIAASSTIVASTPLQPASMDTAKPFDVLRMMRPVATTSWSNSVTSHVEICASVTVHGATNHSCAHGVNSRPNSVACSTRKRMKKRSTPRFYPARRNASLLRARQRGILREVMAHAVGDRLGEPALLARVPQLRLLVGIGNECGLDEDRRNVRRLEHGEARLLDRILVQRVDRLELVQHVAADPEAVVDLRRLRQVEQRARHQRVLDVEVDAADQVGGILL